MWPVPLTLTTTKTAERAASKDFSGVFRAWTKVWAHCRWLPPADRLTGFSPSTCLCLHLKKVMVYFSKDILSSLFTARQKENNTRFQQLTEAIDPSILAARSLIGKLSPFYTTKKEKWKKQNKIQLDKKCQRDWCETGFRLRMALDCSTSSYLQLLLLNSLGTTLFIEQNRLESYCQCLPMYWLYTVQFCVLSFLYVWMMWKIQKWKYYKL